MTTAITTEQYLRRLFERAMCAVDVEKALTSVVSCSGGAIEAGGYRYPLKDFDSVLVVAVGKAALSMTEALAAVISAHVGPESPGAAGALRGMVISGAAPMRAVAGLEYLISGHPYPDATSRIAADKVLALLRTCDARTLVFFLISGGGSAMMERPLRESVSIEDTVGFYKALVSSGLPIVQMNALRKHFSAVKGGRLAAAANGAAQCTLVVSDVPDGALDMVASGPSMPDGSTVEDCQSMLRDSHLLALLPESVRSLFSDPRLDETVKPDDLAFRRAGVVPLLSNGDLLREVSSFLSADGYAVVVDTTCDDWDYASAGAYLLERLRALRQEHRRVCLVSGGEVSVRLPAQVGRGGRNQHFALWCALQLSGTREPFTILSVGTDGVDGNSPAAGAVVDRDTCSRGSGFGLDAQAALEGFDSFGFLSAVSATIISGATGNNIRDLRVLVAKE